MLTAMFAAALAVLVLSVSTPSAFAQAPAANSANVVPQQGAAKVQDEFRGVLTQYGRFVQHAKYGEVWLPTVTPQGWRPYPPCNWVNTRKYGWYYDDKTPWGAIVHHYGRWVSDAQMGWIWTPGAEFSPGWVVWRTSPEWVGWAPMLPDQDVQTVSTADFNSAAYWIFVETQKFAQGCNGAAPPSADSGAADADDLCHRHQARVRNHCHRVAGIRGRPVDRHRHLLLAVAGLVPGAEFDDWNFIWNNLAVMSAVAPDCPQVGPKQGGGPKPLPVSNPVLPLPPRADKPIDNGPPVVVVVPPPPLCPRGTIMDHGVCRLPDSCRAGMLRVGNLCVFPTRPDPLPKPPVTENPCANLSGIALRRCLHVHRPHGGDGKPPVVGLPPAVNPNGRIPDVTIPSKGPGDNVRIKEPVQLPKRLPSTTSSPMRLNPNPVVLAPGGGGLNKTTIGAAPQASNAAAPRPLPVALPEKKTVTR